MSPGFANRRDKPIADSPHPNEVDRRRIARALAQRQRYRYVTPQVTPIASGYQIAAPCCSRNVDRDGGVVDIARILYIVETGFWWLYRKDHAAGCWVIYGQFVNLPDIFPVLNEDPQRLFWQ